MNVICPLALLTGAKVTVKVPHILSTGAYGSKIGYSVEQHTVDYSCFYSHGNGLMYFKTKECGKHQSFNSELLISID